MKKIILTLLFGIASIFSYSQHTQTYTANVNISPQGGQGLEGSVTIFYAFGNCFGDAVLAYGYNNLNINAYHYNGKRYTESDLGVSFNNRQYVQTTSISRMDARISLNGVFVNTVTLGTILPKFDTGCYGQTKKIGSSKENGIDGWQASFSNVNVSARYSLVTKIKNLEKEKQNQEQYNNLISQANNAQTNQQKLDFLNQAKKYANNSQKSQLENQIQTLRNQIEQEKQQQNSVAQTQQNTSSGTDYWGTGNSNSNTNSNNSTVTTTETKSEKVLREYNESVEKQNREREAALNGNGLSANNQYYVNAVSSATMSSLNGDYQAATQQYSQLAANGFSTGNSKNAIVGTTGALLSAWQNAAQQRRQREYEYNQFMEQAEKGKREAKRIIDIRKDFVNQPKLKSTVYEDGSSFKPLYVYFAYVDKNYTEIIEDIDYPSTLSIGINNTEVKFSQVFAFFPYSNGQYPLISDIKKKILNEHFRNKKNEYNVFFFPWERSVKDIVNSLQSNMNNAVNKYYFASAIPSEKNEIDFIVSNTANAQTKDYWTGEKVKKKETKKTDYWKN